MQAGYPRGVLERRDGRPATDLDLAVLLVNSLDYLEDPFDRLTDLAWFAAVLIDVGHPALAESLSSADLPGLRGLRVNAAYARSRAPA